MNKTTLMILVVGLSILSVETYGEIFGGRLGSRICGGNGRGSSAPSVTYYTVPSAYTTPVVIYYNSTYGAGSYYLYTVPSAGNTIQIMPTQQPNRLSVAPMPNTNPGLSPVPRPITNSPSTGPRLSPVPRPGN